MSYLRRLQGFVMDQKETEQWWNLGAVKRRLVTYCQPCSFPLLCPGALPCRGGVESAERLGLSWMTCLSLPNVTLIMSSDPFMSSLLLGRLSSLLLGRVLNSCVSLIA